MLKKVPRQTKFLLGILAGMVLFTTGFFIWARLSGALSSSASMGNTGVFANLSGKVTNASTGAAISGATVAIVCTNNKTILNIGLVGTNRLVTTGSDGMYNLTQANGGNTVKIKTTTSIPINVPGMPNGNTYVYTYTMTVSAAGYQTKTIPNLRWPSYNQGATLPNMNVQLSKTGGTGGGGTGTGTLSGQLYVTASGKRDMACTAIHAGGVCTVNLTLIPSGSREWTGIGRSSTTQTGPVTISESLTAGTYQVTGGNVRSTVTGGSYNLSKVNGSPLPYSITIASGATKIVTLDFQ